MDIQKLETTHFFQVHLEHLLNSPCPRPQNKSQQIVKEFASHGACFPCNKIKSQISHKTKIKASHMCGNLNLKTLPNNSLVQEEL